MTNPLIFSSNSFYFFFFLFFFFNVISYTYVKTFILNERKGKETVC